MIPLITTNDVSGYVLAGGMSRRMGRDKRVVEFGGMTLLDRACAVLEEATGERPTVVVGKHTDFTVPGRAIIRDRFENAGPLAGIDAALRHCETELAILLAVDLPFVTARLIAALRNSRNEENIVMPSDADGNPQPLCALYHVASCRKIVAKHLEVGNFAVRALSDFAKVRSVSLTSAGVPPNSLMNVNTLADLESAARML